MRKTLAGSLLIAGMLLGGVTVASAQPGYGREGMRHESRPAHMERGGYWYRHHHYRHRAWDRRHHRWHYY